MLLLGMEGRKATGEEDDATFTIVRSFKIEQSFYEDSCAWGKLRNSGRKSEFFAFYDIIARWVSLTKIFRLQACFLLQWLQSLDVFSNSFGFLCIKIGQIFVECY